MSHLSRLSRAAPSVFARQFHLHVWFLGFAIPIEPPADIEQYSKRPSNIGQSSPTLSVCDEMISKPADKRVSGSVMGRDELKTKIDERRYRKDK